MGVQAVKRLKRVLAYTATWATNVLTVTTTGNHNLKNDDIVSILLPTVTNDLYNVAVTVTGADTFTVPHVNHQPITGALVGFVEIPYFSYGQTGDQEIFSISAQGKSIATSVIQFTAHGAAGAVLDLSVSNDKEGWVSVATITLASADLATDFVLVSNNWNYGKLSITSIGLDTTVVVTVAS